MTITAKYPGKCSKCSQPIQVGDRIDWKKGEGAAHVDCNEAESAAQPTTATFAPTDEQAAALEAFGRGVNLIVQAGAGTGKTSTLTLLAQSTPRRGAYIAFNRAIVAEARQKFPGTVEVRTAHSHAYRAVGYRFAKRIDGARMKTSEIAARLGIAGMTFDHAGVAGEAKILTDVYLASLTMKTITKFCQSADRDIAAIHVPFVTGLDAPGEYTNNNQVSRYLLPFARKAWADLTDPNGVLRFSPDVYLKMWQLAGPRIQVDYIMFDEAQDANPVMVAIVEAQMQHGTQIVWVGDSQQQIYSFTGAINALDMVPRDEETFLTQSFRFGDAVAAVANRCLAELDAPLRIRGWDQIASQVTPVAEPDAILCRTNAAAVRSFLTALDNGASPHIVGGGEQIVRFAKAARDLQNGRGTDHPELACFADWNEVRAYVAEDEEGGDLKLMVTLTDDFGADTIIAALETMPDERNADIVISTAHKAKGREWDTVQLAGDFPDQAAGEEMRLLYVAVTRARIELDITAVAALNNTAKEVA